MQLVRVFEIHRRDATNSLRINVRGSHALSEREGAEDRELRTRIETVDVGGRIGLGITGSLCFGQDRVKRSTARFNFRQDVIAGAVENAVERGDAISGDSFAQDSVNRYAA